MTMLPSDVLPAKRVLYLKPAVVSTTLDDPHLFSASTVPGDNQETPDRLI
jgi:hypothetical protein